LPGTHFGFWSLDFGLDAGDASARRSCIPEIAAVSNPGNVP
jgi:hypothetical protein